MRQQRTSDDELHAEQFGGAAGPIGVAHAAPTYMTGLESRHVTRGAALAGGQDKERIRGDRKAPRVPTVLLVQRAAEGRGQRVIGNESLLSHDPARAVLDLGTN